MSVKRSVAEYENLSERFLLGRDDTAFDRQYCGLYEARLRALRPRLERQARVAFGADVPVRKLAELAPNEDCVIVGTVVKQQALRPSVLKQIAEELNEVPQPIGGKYTGDDDHVLLEDDVQQVRLTGDVHLGRLVTGVVVAVRGAETPTNGFCVSACLLPTGDAPPRADCRAGCSVLFVSGLGFTGRDGEDGRTMLAASLLADWLTGAVGGEDERRDAAAVCRLVVAGNSISANAEDREFSQKARYLTRKHVSPSVECVRNVDEFLARMSALLPVDLMAGENDPTNRMLPQQPLHRCLFPRAAGNESLLQRVTNPYDARLAGRRLLGTSGQNVDDIYRYSEQAASVDILESVLQWGVLCPTAPDTLDCYPFLEHDPFLICPADDSCAPDVLFAGNQQDFAYRSVERVGGGNTLLLAIPSFKKTRSAVLLHLDSLQPRLLSFGQL